jgi:amidase
MPFGPDAVPAFETVWYAMATLAPVDPAREDRLLPFTAYMRERGRETRASDLVFAQAYLQLTVRHALAVLNGYDALLMPTLASPPVPVGYFEEVPPAENFERQKAFTPFTALFNVSGQPAVSLPLHWNEAGLPIGVMLAGRVGEEGTLISLSAQLEEARPWRDRHPALW